MHGLLAIALTMYPMRIDESIHTQLREKYGDKMLRMQKGWGRRHSALLGRLRLLRHQLCFSRCFDTVDWTDLLPPFIPETCRCLRSFSASPAPSSCRRWCQTTTTSTPTTTKSLSSSSSRSLLKKCSSRRSCQPFAGSTHQTLPPLLPRQNQLSAQTLLSASLHIV